MTALNEVEKWMTFFGWTNKGGPGSEKIDADNAVIAVHGDAVWIADVEECVIKAEREAIINELARRDATAIEPVPLGFEDANK